MTETRTASTAFLARLISPTGPFPELLLLTGESGAGKTTMCLELLRQARVAGLHPVGLVSPAVFESGLKTGIDLLDVATGERRRLAVQRADPLPPPQAGAHALHWQFDPQVIAWGNQLLEHLPTSALLFLDELGPLEFRYGDGLTAGLRRLDARLDRSACVVIRPSLLEAAQVRWPWGQVWTVGGAPSETSQP